MTIASFLDHNELNLDKKTVKSFSEEWEKFNVFSPSEIEEIGKDYFDIVPGDVLTKNTVALDVGCGSGRWSKYLADKVKFIEAIDPSASVITACKILKEHPNVRVTQASASNIPFPDKSFDFVFSLGVLHHIPNTQLALRRCIEKLKPGGHLLIYLYYSLDNRGLAYRLTFQASNFIRFFVSKLPGILKKSLCDLIALLVYLPLSRVASVLKNVGMKNWNSIPLAYYSDKSFNILRNDALDRFGTPLEQRFSKAEIHNMLEEEGMIEITFSENAPFWHVISKKTN